MFDRFVALLEQLDWQDSSLLRVLTYHRVDEPNARPALAPQLAITPAIFDQQMCHLAAYYHVLSIREVLEVCNNGGAVPKRAVLVTFDDAYCDFAEHAWPILQRYHIPVTLFVPTAFPGAPERTFWWDRLFQALHFTSHDELITPVGCLPLEHLSQRARAYRRLREYVKSLPHQEAIAWVEQVCQALDTPPPQASVMGWDMLRQLADEGVVLGAHTRTHPLINRVSAEEARAEIVGSLRDLEREIGETLPIFAYPSGGFDDGVVQLLACEGLELAFTTTRGVNDLRMADRLRLRRINVGQRTTLSLLRPQLTPWTVHLNPWYSLSNA
ncbi:MAG: polysaccharide deacetylase family protein [Chloroflexota bacterium]|nr:polysaccharide deacetylase family protein [Chloroflexota bacterium]